MSNSVRLRGVLGADPVVRYAASGNKVVELSVGERFSRDKETRWHTVVCFKSAAERAQHFLRTNQIVVEGFLDYEKIPMGEKTVKAARIKLSRASAIDRIDTTVSAVTSDSSSGPDVGCSEQASAGEMTLSDYQKLLDHDRTSAHG